MYDFAKLKGLLGPDGLDVPVSTDASGTIDFFRLNKWVRIYAVGKTTNYLLAKTLPSSLKLP